MSSEENSMPDARAVPSSSTSAITSVTASPVAHPPLKELAAIEASSQTLATALIDRDPQNIGATSAQDDLFSAAIVSGITHISEHSQTAPLANTTAASYTYAGAALSALQTHATFGASVLSPPTRVQVLTSKYDAMPYIRQAPLMACIESDSVSAHTSGSRTSAMNAYHSSALCNSVNNFGGHRPAANSTFVHSLAEGFSQGGNVSHNCAHMYSGAAQVQAPYALPCTTQVWTSSHSQPFSFVSAPAGLQSGAYASQNSWGAFGQSVPYTTYDATLLPSHVAARQAITKDLPSFSGRPEEWPLFITNYVQSTERCGFSDQENLIRLQKCLKGAALESVRGKLMMPATVNLAIETLRMLFGRPDVIHETLQRKLREVPPVRIERLETLIELALAVQNYRATMQALGLEGYMNDPMLLNELLSKLPGEMKLEWGRRRLGLARVDIITFDEWLFGLASCASQVTPVNSTLPDVKAGNKGRRERLLVHDACSTSANSVAVSQKPSCPKCSGAHDLAECRDFKALSRQSRWQLVKEKRLCIRCFKNHQVRRCNSNKFCGVDGCRLAHNPLLHGQRLQQQNRPHEGDDTGNADVDKSVICLHQKQHDRAIFRYVPVTLHANGVTLETVALIDEGASCTLLDETLARQLKLNGPSEELCLRWTSNITQQEKNSQIVSFEISARGNDAVKYGLRSVRTIANLELPLQSLKIDDIRERDHLKSLPIVSYDSSRAGLLIGLDHVKLCVPLEIRQSRGDGLVAARCRLGWSVYGRDKHGGSAKESLMHICECSKGDNLDNLMRSFFSVESVGISPTVKPPMSKEDERALQIMQRTTKYIESEKRWETGLLWRFDRIDLPQSYNMAHKRLECLERKMDKDPHLKDFITERIQDYLCKGYVRKLRKDEISTRGKAWYIPIFTVLNVNKGKRRLVWDAAAKVEGTALNDVLLKGPDLLRSLVGVLLRFREKPVALCGDIREMFHQVRVIKGDQAAQQFLWRDGDSTREPDTFVMVVMTFGASCSPSLANYIKNRNADRFKERFPSAVAAIVQNTFVDDWLQSVETEDEMIRLATEVRHIHSEGGFEMRHWLSNSERVLRVMAGQSELVDKCLEEPGDGAEKVLGMWWRPHTDELMFVQKFKKQLGIPTKREILRAVMTIFDPLGLLGFFVIKAKMILQDVWRSGVTWDEAIHDKERTAWWHWVRKLQSLNNVRIPRCYMFVSRCENLELHIFVDSSVLAYAAVAYLRAEVKGEFYCSFVMSKTRVAPLKPISVPRLELMAAILGLRLARFVQDELSVAISRRVFWSDSKDVLYWIRSDARKFNQFVAVRIGEILQESQINEWRWVPSKNNVADDGTKWDDSLILDSSARWFTGPDFLRAPEDCWPQSEFIESHEEGLDAVHCVNDERDVSNSCAPDPARFSKWERLRAVQMCVLRFLRLVMKSEAKSPLTERLLRDKTCDGAELLIFRECQSESFADELNQLKQPDSRVSRKSKIFKFSPYVDENGLLRVKGRIDAAGRVSTDVKRPIILPRDHRVTYLVTDFYHRKYHHQHNEIVVNEMRQRFCVHGLRALVRSVAKTCQLCRNYRASPVVPEMGPLPMDRVAAFTRPFTYTGVDYFGPFNVVIGKRHEKRWGVLFTCMTVRAVHVEISASLSTDSFLLVLRQFMCRRGVPRRITSDNGTNFRGASRVLAQEIEQIAFNLVEQKYPEIEWVFIPPSAPHMGGAWERMVRTIKSVLMTILPENCIREEVLRAAIAEAESTVNMRPLTYLPIESPESEALTPNHFLLGSSSGIREKGICEVGASALSKNFRIAGQIADQFWKRWLREYLPCLTRRSKWLESQTSIQLEDVVVIVDENSKRNTWTRGRVFDVIRSKDGHIRSAVVKTSSGLMTRPVVKLARLDVQFANPVAPQEVCEEGC